MKDLWHELVELVLDMEGKGRDDGQGLFQTHAVLVVSDTAIMRSHLSLHNDPRIPGLEMPSPLSRIASNPLGDEHLSTNGNVPSNSTWLNISGRVVNTDNRASSATWL
jgi:hypothetical protein